MSDMQPAVVVHDLHKDFILPQHKDTSLKQTVVNITRKNGKTTQRVLDGINFEVGKGDFFGIVGRNGSGVKFCSLSWRPNGYYLYHSWCDPVFR